MLVSIYLQLQLKCLELVFLPYGMLMSYLYVKHLTFGRVYATNHGDQFSYCINILLEVTSALAMT